jgi:LL-diaminopimelate aminotransferase
MNKKFILLSKLMVKLNHHYQKLRRNNLFPEVERRIALFKSSHPDHQLINLGIGDFSRPLPSSVVSAITSAAEEMGKKEGFKGYGPSEGYHFLREAIAQGDYAGLGIESDEIFISDGAHSDISNLQEIFSIENRIAIPSPSYPIYLETNVMAGRTRLQLKTGLYGGVTYLPCTPENGFNPEPPHHHVDLIYLCSPNNPTGIAMSKGHLKCWIDYAQEHESIIIMDGAYQAYISTDAPRSIYEIDGAKEVAIEVKTFSKCAGFTGLRCGYTVVPKQLIRQDTVAIHSIHSLWKRRVESKSNGVSYPIQRAAAALYTPQGRKEIQEIIQEIAQPARFLKNGLKQQGYTVCGGVDSPYVWCKAPPEVTSWDFFDLLLEQAQIITVPGYGFGDDGFIRFSAFAGADAVSEGFNRIKNIITHCVNL